MLYSIRSERLLMEELDYNLLFRWFVGLNADDAVWDATVFTKNHERLLDGDIAEAFFQAVLQQARERSLLSDEHFTVDGTLLEAWASVKSYQRKEAKDAVPPDDPGNATVDFHGEKSDNAFRRWRSRPDVRARGKDSKVLVPEAAASAKLWAGWLNAAAWAYADCGWYASERILVTAALLVRC
jgi:IS5 family transposase